MLIEHARSFLLLVDLQEKLMPAMVEPDWLGRQIGVLLAAARELAVPVVASEQYPTGLGPTVANIAGKLQQSEIFAKTEFSCYANPALRRRFEAAGDQVVVAGIEAHVCVLQTALDLRAAGRSVFVVADAVSSRRPESREIALQRLAANGVTLVTVEMVLFEWLRRADRPEFKPVSRLIR
ncbi:MAG TPA: hydrolase [Dongiaceae bacterium]|nr:hydrolase [Dongiaceae bacterium]